VVRKAREKSDTGTYHIMIRGIDRQLILEDEEDNQKLKEVLHRCKEICGYKIYGYILFK
jgi:REP element-mobilizing transposase RayT